MLSVTEQAIEHPWLCPRCHRRFALPDDSVPMACPTCHEVLKHLEPRPDQPVWMIRVRGSLRDGRRRVRNSFRRIASLRWFHSAVPAPIAPLGRWTCPGCRKDFTLPTNVPPPKVCPGCHAAGTGVP